MRTLQLAAKGLVEQRFFQFVERGDLLIVDGFETIGGTEDRVQFGHDRLLRCQVLRKVDCKLLNLRFGDSLSSCTSVFAGDE